MISNHLACEKITIQKSSTMLANNILLRVWEIYHFVNAYSWGLINTACSSNSIVLMQDGGARVISSWLLVLSLDLVWCTCRSDGLCPDREPSQWSRLLAVEPQYWETLHTTRGLLSSDLSWVCHRWTQRESVAQNNLPSDATSGYWLCSLGSTSWGLGVYISQLNLETLIHVLFINLLHSGRLLVMS